jgi:hypothetical protein
MMPLLLDRLSVYGEMLEVASHMLAARASMTRDEFRALVLPARENETLESELVAYLRELGIAEIEEHTLRRALTPRLATGDALRLHVLATLRAVEDENAVILDLYRFLLEDEASGQRVLDRDAVWPRYNQHREPLGGQAVVMNSPKMASWLRLMTFVGLVRPERSNAFILSPGLDLLRAMLQREVGPDGDGLAAVIARLEARFCPLLQFPGALHPGHADAFALLERRGEITLTAVGDADGVLMRDRRVTHIALVAGANILREG